MTPKVWGPPIWIFLHAFSVNISEYGYSKIGMQFYAYLARICRLLPCPECSEHATKYISNIKPAMLKTKYDLANMLCHFHNSVNFRKKLPFFNPALLSAYENVSIITAFNNFAKAFTLPTQRLMNENLHRKWLVSHLQTFISTNFIYFIKTTVPRTPLTESIENPSVTEIETESVIEELASLSTNDSDESLLQESTGSNSVV